MIEYVFLALSVLYLFFYVFSPYLFFSLVEGLDIIFLFIATFRKK